MDKLIEDHHTLSNINEIRTDHIDLHLEAHFDTCILDGYVDIHATLLQNEIDMFILDTSELTIKKILIYNKEVNQMEYKRKINPIFGMPLCIPLHNNMKIHDTCIIRIYYSTTPNSTALQWLLKEQTANKNFPYLFSQCQAIHARALLPCQDSPSIKCTYSASIIAPSWSKVLMSAIPIQNSKKENKIEFQFEQKVAIPSYLIAIVIGDIESREIGPRSTLYCESSMINEASYEFSQTEEFLKHAEKIIGQEYVWGRYDLVCLPPSFPYGGMENPCLTFITPTLIAGDRSLADVVAHEIAHSWTGNLVTNLTWEHFWLNEGWTMWLQRKIMVEIHSNELFFDFDAISGYNDLMDSVKHYGINHNYTKLVPNLYDVDPDDAFSSIPYEKGFNFLYYLSNIVNHKNFEQFAKAYIQEFKFKTLTSDDFIEFFKNYFLNISKNCINDDQKIMIHNIDWDSWLYSPGMPVIEPVFNTSLSRASDTLAMAWINKDYPLCSTIDISNWASLQISAMLEKMINYYEQKKEEITLEIAEKMNNLYNFNNTKNAEIRFHWQTLCIRGDIKFIYPLVEIFLKEQGRMKYIRPLYRELIAISKEGRILAIRIFNETKENYHSTAIKMITKDLKL